MKIIGIEVLLSSEIPLHLMVICSKNWIKYDNYSPDNIYIFVISRRIYTILIKVLLYFQKDFEFYGKKSEMCEEER